VIDQEKIAEGMRIKVPRRHLPNPANFAGMRVNRGKHPLTQFSPNFAEFR
jgi:hypothetical protein